MFLSGLIKIIIIIIIIIIITLYSNSNQLEKKNLEVIPF